MIRAARRSVWKERAAYGDPLPDEKRLWDEFDTWQNRKFLASNRSQRPEQEKLLAEKAMENTQRRNRLKSLFGIWSSGPSFAIGNETTDQVRSVVNMLDETFSYVIENSFQKLSLLKSCGANPMQKLKAVIVADDTAQLSMHLGEQDQNSSAKQEIEFYLNVRKRPTNRSTSKSLLERFSAALMAGTVMK